ncbi:hypothetical protein NKJ06_34490 [Mesorhizobium sp. M0293]|uniref:hypothetical protein n=1 Tax=Mesorhizobium sp. M0293 TaxID=2956930 RepID=UPI0033354716
MRKVIDFFWPTSERPTPEERRQATQKIEEQIAHIDQMDWGGDTDTALEEARRLVDSDEARRRTAEARATTFLLLIGALTPVVTFLGGFSWMTGDDSTLRLVAFVLLSIGICYLFSAGRWSLKTIQVGVFYDVHVSDIVKIWENKEVKQNLLRHILQSVVRNRDANNFKITCIKIAHMFVLRAILIFSAFLLLPMAWDLVSKIAASFTGYLRPMVCG